MKKYYEKFEEIIKSLDGKKKLLLHSCCAPCSSSVLERLKDYFDVTVYYYNPNIAPFSEFERRLKEQITLLEKLKIKYIIGEYEPEEFSFAIKGYETYPEGSERCKHCYYFRMRNLAKLAKENNFDFFTTTLSVSPHKNAVWINEIGKELENEFGVKFLTSDFKKKNGYLRSLELSREYGLYRQEYCGCRPRKENSETDKN